MEALARAIYFRNTADDLSFLAYADGNRKEQSRYDCHIHLECVGNQMYGSCGVMVVMALDLTRKHGQE